MTTAVVTPARLQDDLSSYASLVNAPYDPSVVSGVLDALAGVWPSSWLAVRTTTKAEREVSIRFMNLAADADPVGRLRRAGLLRFDGHPRERLLESVLAAGPVMYGVDVAVGTGVQKIWLVIPELMSVERLLSLRGLPAAVHEYAEHLRRWTDDRICMIALDFENGTMNIYGQVFQPGRLEAADIATVLSEVGAVPAGAADLAALESASYTIYWTFDWERAGVRRVCFPRRFTRENFPVRLDPLLAKFVAGAPLVEPGPHGFTLYIAYGPGGRYYKVQADYVALGAEIRLPGNVEVPRTH
ncbi:aromatic prenyltransferase [Nocardia pseudobrasiliensis]|uniref:Aromatic prenyltransferase Orf2 n=1 Tax=Nocardia pseudobrasiliensis TaxID=45979 RepID=A0A370IB74_9NOCA|nr:aromatic prenyltransferase [Nocardia pseudobrasiliensis]RDI67976.1 aromatic prenyltransferase Orf2 [Nocardia pseudobrasiliensis]